MIASRVVAASILMRHADAIVADLADRWASLSVLGGDQGSHRYAPALNCAVLALIVVAIMRA